MSAKNRERRAQARQSRAERPEPGNPLPPSTLGDRFAAWGAVVCLLLFAVLLFARLGHYALWDDETMVALVAQGVLRTGDTSVVLDHNTVLYNNGVLVWDLHDRSTPPLATYVAAAALGLLGENAFVARLPFALFGLATVGLILWWMRKDGAPPMLQLFIALGCLGNVSLLLFLRQCRYYGPVLFFTVAVVYLYLHGNHGRRRLWLMTGCSVLLFASNYLNHLALYLCLAFDYFFWTRKTRPLRPVEWAILLLPQLILGGALACVWNPLRTEFGGFVARNDLADRLRLFWWHWRDLSEAEFFVAALVLAAPILGWALRQRRPRPPAAIVRPADEPMDTAAWLLRGSLALFVYVGFITVVSPQVVKETSAADVRYFVPVIPLGIALGALVLGVVARKSRWLALALALLAFGTNLLSGGPLGYLGRVRSTIASYVGELLYPPGDPYTVAARWINEHVGERETISVAPDYMMYPLMFHAPKAVYVWQLRPPVQPQFQHLDKLLVGGVVPPDYIIAFGPAVLDATRLIESGRLPDFHYERVARLDVYWRCLHRPELFWRSFKPVDRFKPDTEAIYIFHHTRASGDSPPASSSPPPG